jgi:hypothetical protein
MLSPAQSADPNWLFSTAAQSAAAIVAIVGGFIASRVIDLNARKRSIEGEISALEYRLQEPRRSLETAEQALLRADTTRFHVAVLKALIPREASLASDEDGDDDELAALVEADTSGRSEDELRPTYELARRQVKSAFQQVGPLMSPPGPYPASLEALRDRGLAIPPGPSEWIYAHVLGALRERDPSDFLAAGVALQDVPAEPVVLDESSIRFVTTARTQSRNRIHELEAELRIQHQAADRISNPEALPSALVVLGYFAIVGIIWPLAVIAVNPRTVSAPIRLATLVLFVSGLAAVVWYIAARVRELGALLPETLNETTTSGTNESASAG